MIPEIIFFFTRLFVYTFMLIQKGKIVNILYIYISKVHIFVISSAHFIFHAVQLVFY